MRMRVWIGCLRTVRSTVSPNLPLPALPVRQAQIVDKQVAVVVRPELVIEHIGGLALAPHPLAMVPHRRSHALGESRELVGRHHFVGKCDLGRAGRFLADHRFGVPGFGCGSG